MSDLGRRVGMDEDDKDGVVAKKTKKRMPRKWEQGQQEYIFCSYTGEKKNTSHDKTVWG